ncbi:MAG: hypothetical protein ACM3S1_11115 [Hyphomicrobiales bacterium]
MSQIIAFPARGATCEAAPPPPPQPPHDRERDALRRFARELDTLDPAVRRPLAALLAAIDETGEIRAMRRARAAAAYQRTALPPSGASRRLRYPLSSSWLPTLSAAS